MTSSTYNNGVVESRSYNNDNTLASISFTGAAIGTYSYTWDDNKNKTSESITGVMSNYGFTVGTSGYDDEDRLVNWERSDSNLDQAWNLSLVGDWNSFTENSSTQNRTHGPTHELLSAGGSSLTHDAKGNMTLIPAVLRPDSNDLALKWDFENKMTTADVGNDSMVDVTYKWDALGRRVYRDDGSSAVIFVQVGQQTIADYGYSMSPTSPMYNYVYASYIDEPVLRDEPSASELLYFHRNQQYSIIALTGGIGAIEERIAFGSYGVPTFANATGVVEGHSTSVNRYNYTGREWDYELFLYHFRARVYGTLSGRFGGRDPIGYAAGSNGLYTILDSDPMDSADPMGLSKYIGPWGPWGPNTVFGPDGPESPVRLDLCRLKHPPTTDYGGYLKCVHCYDLLNRWLRSNSDLTWINELPKCPCDIRRKYYLQCGNTLTHYETNELVSPGGFHNDDGLIFGYHPGAKKCIRSTSDWFPTVPVQQCCYDNAGNLITSGAGAGTPDRNFPGHWESEVEPFNYAHYLDGNDDYNQQGFHVQLFLGVRPPDRGSDHWDRPCPLNRKP